MHRSARSSQESLRFIFEMSSGVLYSVQEFQEQ